MPNYSARYLLVAVLVFGFVSVVQTQTASPKPLTASEVLALQAGGTLAGNIAHHIAARGLSFRPDKQFLDDLKLAGADTIVLSAVHAAKVTADQNSKLDNQLLSELSQASVLMKKGRYDEAATALGAALKSSFAAHETGFVMGELLRNKQEYQQAEAVFSEIANEDPDFPEVHTKLSFILYRLGDSEQALHEAKLALALNPEDAEAHKNAGLALDQSQKFEGAISEYQAALRIKPDYAAVHYDLGNIYSRTREYDKAIAEYQKAILLDPKQPDFHYNLGTLYYTTKNMAAAVREQREAKRLNPNDPTIRQNLASALMALAPQEAIQELKELEQLFPDFEMCHVCLGSALLWSGDRQGAEAEYRRASELDPSDPEPHTGLGRIQENQNNYDGALEEYRIAERLGMNVPHTHQDVARMLLGKQDVPGEIAELKNAEALSPSDWHIHHQLGQALGANAQTDLAISEFKEAIALDSNQPVVFVDLGLALERKGDWVGALESERNAAISESSRMAKMQNGESVPAEIGAAKQYKAAQLRFADHLASLRATRKAAEAAELQKRVQALDTSPDVLVSVRRLMQRADEAFKQRQFDVAEQAYKEAVQQAEHLPPGDENLIVALGRLGSCYGMRQDYPAAEATWHRQLTVIEKTFGAQSPRAIEPLSYLGSLAAGLKNYAAAESYFSRALDINLKNFGENNARTSESLRAIAGVYMVQNHWAEAETYLLRAVKANEVATGPDDNMVLIPLWGLCDLYDRWQKPPKSQPCWHRATEILEKQVGANSSDLSEPISREVRALRELGRDAEASQLELRLAKIKQTAQVQ